MQTSGGQKNHFVNNSKTTQKKNHFLNNLGTKNDDGVIKRQKIISL